MHSFPDYGLNYLRRGKPIEKVFMRGLELSMIAVGDGTEVIHHTLEKDTRWAIGPSEGWTALECVFVIRGKLRCIVDHHDWVAKAGDSFSTAPVKRDVMFIALEDTEFLYISSQPVFHMYSQQVQAMRELAISVEEKDGYTADHCQRILDLSMAIGDKLQLSNQDMYDLNLGSFFHDVGKVIVPLEILCKPGKLTADEWNVMKNHTSYGRKMLQDTGLPYLQAPGVIVEQHHERFLGQGYPNGLDYKKTHIGSSIVAVVDSFDAMTSDRVYQKGRTSQAAVAEIVENREKLYHPDVVDAFVSVVADLLRKGGEDK